MAEAINSLKGVQSVQVTRRDMGTVYDTSAVDTAPFSMAWSVTFINLSGDVVNLTPVYTNADATQNEKQLLRFWSAVDNVPLSGQYKLRNEFGEETACIDIDSNKTHLENVLESLGSFDDVNITKSIITKPGVGASYEVEFTGDKVSRNVGQLDILIGDAAADCAALSKNAHYDIETIFPGSSNREVQRYNISGNDPTGAYQLVFDGQTTDCIYANASDSFVKMKLDALSTITSVSVTRSQSYEYRITFSGAGMHGNQNQITTTSCAPFTNGKDLTNSQITTIVDGGNTITLKLPMVAVLACLAPLLEMESHTAPLIWHQLLRFCRRAQET